MPSGTKNPNQNKRFQLYEKDLGVNIISEYYGCPDNYENMIQLKFMREARKTPKQFCNSGTTLRGAVRAVEV